MNTCAHHINQRCKRQMRHVVVDTNCLLRMIPLRSKYRPVWEAFLNGQRISAPVKGPNIINGRKVVIK